MEYTKKKRKVDHLLLRYIRTLGCCINGCKRKPVVCCHIKTRGSGGDDVLDNVFPACLQHHTEQGLSFSKMMDKYPEFKDLMTQKGWGMVNGQFRKIKI